MNQIFMPPKASCQLCPRLCAFRAENKHSYPTFFNGAVPSFGSLDSEILVVGLAPGLKGANATGRPFTGDFAGDILYAALTKAGLSRGRYDKRADDGFDLCHVRITNAVRCVPPENKPTPEEAATCNPFLQSEIAAMEHLRCILVLGSISHNAVLKTLGVKQSSMKFAHGAEHTRSINGRSIIIVSSYHTSRYNIQTRRLSGDMFDVIIARTKMLAGLK